MILHQGTTCRWNAKLVIVSTGVDPRGFQRMQCPTTQRRIRRIWCCKTVHIFLAERSFRSDWASKRMEDTVKTDIGTRSTQNQKSISRTLAKIRYWNVMSELRIMYFWKTISDFTDCQFKVFVKRIRLMQIFVQKIDEAPIMNSNLKVSFCQNRLFDLVLQLHFHRKLFL